VPKIPPGFAPAGWDKVEGVPGLPVLSKLRTGAKRPPVLFMSRAAARVLAGANVMESHEGTRALSGHASEASIRVAELWRDSLDSLPETATVTASKKVSDDLVALMRAAIERGDTRAMVIIVDDPASLRVGRLRELFRHEGFHGAQANAGLDFPAILSDPAFLPYLASEAVRRGVSVLVEDYGYDHDAALLMEMGARMAAGQYKRLGLSRGEAVEALALYYEAAEKIRSEGARELLEFMIPTLREEVLRAKRSRQERAGLLHQVAGHRLRREWLKPSGDPELARMVDAMTMAGGRIKMDSAFRTNFRDKFLQALKRGNVFGAALRAPFAAVEAAAWPIMEFVVPRQKLGVFYELAKSELERLGPNAPREEVRRAYQRAWDVVDDRLGEVVYDNLFWNRTSKDVSHLLVQSVGWNWGTFRVLGGGAKDLAMLPVRAFKEAFGRGDNEPPLSHRAAYMLGFITVTAVAGAILQKLLTGQNPESIEDLIFPRTGELDEAGRPRRIAQPTYLKDAVHYYHDPLRTLANKVSPVVDLMADMLNNKDFYGTEIWHPDDPLFDKFLDIAKRTGEQFVPFGVREMQQARSQGRGLKGQVLPFFGYTPAPKSITSSPAEELLLQYIRANQPQGARTKLQTQRAQLRGQLRGAIRRQLQGVPGGLSAADVAREGGRQGLFTKDDLVRAVKEAPVPFLVSGFKRLELEQAIRVYEEANPDERRLLSEAMWGNVDAKTNKRTAGKVDLLLNRPPAEQERLAKRIRALLPSN
jgi:hypothetical protein